jgi:hypothetical protein
MAFKFGIAVVSRLHPRWEPLLRAFHLASSAVLLAALNNSSAAQIDPGRPQASDEQINVNWFYGPYVPNNVPLQSLSRHQRFQLYIRQTYTTPGIYIKTTLFAIHDRITVRNPEWGDGFDGFAKRLGDRQVQFMIQNSVTSLGDGIFGWEPRYDRCRCDRFWPRTRHAINFVTYDRTEKSLRPQLMPYLGAFGGAVFATAWQPGNPAWRVRGYQAAITQVFVGIGINGIGEFTPEIVWAPRKKSREALAKRSMISPCSRELGGTW